jgi:hypothetical protein
MSLTRAAVIIAVRNAGDLPELQAALDGAKAMQKWAKARDFESVVTITDEKTPVTASKIKKSGREDRGRGRLRKSQVVRLHESRNTASAEFSAIPAPRRSHVQSRSGASVPGARGECHSGSPSSRSLPSAREAPASGQ